MGDWIKKNVKAFSEKGGIFMFMRAQFSSQVASATDFLVTILLVKLFGIYYVYATFTGSICGGIVNCIINYKWTFKTKDCKKRHVMIKYLLVWIGSILLNTWGNLLHDGSNQPESLGQGDVEALYRQPLRLLQDSSLATRRISLELQYATCLCLQKL